MKTSEIPPFSTSGKKEDGSPLRLRWLSADDPGEVRAYLMDCSWANLPHKFCEVTLQKQSDGNYLMSVYAVDGDDPEIDAPVRHFIMGFELGTDWETAREHFERASSNVVHGKLNPDIGVMIVWQKLINTGAI